MSESGVRESVVEQAALAWFESLGWRVARASELAPAAEGERQSYAEAVLGMRARSALARLNPGLPAEALDEAFRKLMRPDGASLEARNRSIHRMLVDGVTVEYRGRDGSVRGTQATVIDFERSEANDWLVVNQFMVTGSSKQLRKPDIVLFVNGLPLGVIELKNAADARTTIWSAHQQLQTYKSDVPALFEFNELLIVSDGVDERVGTLTGGREWFKPWRTIAGDDLADAHVPGLQVAIEGLCEHERFLALVRDFLVFEDDGSGELVKKMAGYHQFHAVAVAVGETLRAVDGTETAQPSVSRGGGRSGDRRVGVVWHTQGSGKSLTMLFYAGRIIREPSMGNPTVVVLTDRNDLDDQLFATFSRCSDLLRQPPVQAESRAHLRQLLSTEAGGVVFTTVHKFFPDEKGDQHPTLSDRRNIVVIADEAHRSQYDFVDGFARHMRDALPRASFIGFTGTPIEIEDASTRAVFGEYISVYDIQRAVEDGATVPIYYESRLARLALDAAERPKIDPDFEEVTEGEEVERRDKLKSKWTQLRAVVGSEKRLALLASDLVEHFERRLEVLDGKAMVVCMSRSICVDLYAQIVKLRPDWHSDDDSTGSVKVVMTGAASDPLEWQPHVRTKQRREALAKRFRDPADPLRLVLVRDMWLTGFDAPPLHTMYLDKPMRGHGLMQAIARVNRVFRDKPGGLVVDYLGLAHELRSALATYTESGGTGTTAIDQEAAVGVMIEKLEVCRGIFHGFDWSKWTTGSPEERLALLPAAQEHLLAQVDGRDRTVRATRELSRAFALAVPHDAAIAVRDDVSFFQAVHAVLVKRAPGDTRPEDDLNFAVRQIISRVIAPEGILDVFAAAGLAQPDISILSDEFLAEVRGLPHKNVAVELLRKLLVGELRTRRARNVVQARRFSEMLEEAMSRYQNRAIEAAQVIEELIALARHLREADQRGEELGLSDEEVAFYDALGVSESAVAVLGDDTLRDIARELVTSVRANVTIDWTVRENVRAHLRVLVKRILRKHGYPPDKQEQATRTVLEQAEVLSLAWVTA